jgi:hypothetical protein
VTRRYVVRLIGHDGKLVGQRYTLSYQAIDRLAAVSIPQAEMLRLFSETGGNTAAILAPMSESLKARGYDTLMVVPAQTRIVELSETASGHPDDPQMIQQAAWFDEARRVEGESAKLLVECTAMLLRVASFLAASREAGASELRVEVSLAANRAAVNYVTKG